MLRMSALALGGLLLATVPPSAGSAADLCRIQGSGIDTVRLSNLSSGAAPTELRAGRLRGRVTLSADRRRLFIPTEGGLSVLDLKRLRVVDTIPVAAEGLFAVGPDDTVYFTESDGAGIVLRVLDTHRRAVVHSVALPDGVVGARNMSIGDGGRLLFIATYSSSGAGVAIVDLTSARLLSTWTSPTPYSDVFPQANPTRDFAYVLGRAYDATLDRIWLVRSDAAAEPLALPAGPVVFSPDGLRAYVVRNGQPDGADRTVLVDTDHQFIADLPSGDIVGFAADDCVVITNGRDLRRACPGAERSEAIDPATLSAANTPPVDNNVFAAAAWTTGPCQAPPSGCEDGVACLEIAGAAGAPGESVDIAVRLNTAGAQIPGVQNDLYLDRALGFPLTGTGSPACEINPDINKAPSFFNCQQPAADGCLATRALVLSLSDVDSIPDGSELYRCPVRIPDDTPAGHYRIGCAYAGASTLEGDPLPIRCQESEIVVVATEGTAAAQSGTATSDGCQITRGAATAPATVWWIALFATLAILGGRRRRGPLRR
jgi:hypothetical protein